ncbi:TPA: hypothetical protein CPT89_01115 [Candidatus Gastranaerophilales bacterium HUM_11]|nr:MAG TPA: hypothetical protein CPT89_01115 [Candidatus Gastranaerophilales bacterium HUM_11]DAX39312.1 MAG TPA: hypothetical protein [Caudoviricetes sp.]
MHIETSADTIVQLLLKGDYYEELCPNDEDTWYNLEEVMERPLIQRLISAGTLEMMKAGKIDYIVCRGNW